MRRSFLVLTIPALTLLGCSTSGGEDTANENSAEICARLFDAANARADRCPNVTLGASVDIARPRFETFCQQQLAAPGASKLAAAYVDCSRRLPDTDCNAPDPCALPDGDLDDGAACGEHSQCKSGRCKTAEAPSGAPASTCGTCAPRTAPGAACSTSRECQDGALCVRQNGATALTCTAFEKLHAGEACSLAGTDALCDPGLRCGQTTSGFTCQGPSGAGGPCSMAMDCTGDLLCPFDTHVCTRRPGEGEACDGGCAEGLGCETTTKRCAPLVYGADGDACDNVTKHCRAGACVGIVLDNLNRPTTAGKCVAWLADGAPCGEGIEGRCGYLAECIGGRCEVPDPTVCN